MVHIRPGVLEDGAHLHLETNLVYLREGRVAVQVLGDTANTMQRKIAEAVYLVQLALIYRILPVDVEIPLEQRRYFIYIVDIESNHAQAHDVGYVVDTVILIPLKGKLSTELFFRLDPVFQCRDYQSGRVKIRLQQRRSHAARLHEHRKKRMILV